VPLPAHRMAHAVAAFTEERNDMSNTVNFEHLFTPLQVGPMRVPNRICETTNTINSSMTPGMIDEHFIAHHTAKARGGTGWIGSETWLLHAYRSRRRRRTRSDSPIGCAPHQVGVPESGLCREHGAVLRRGAQVRIRRRRAADPPQLGVVAVAGAGARRAGLHAARDGRGGDRVLPRTPTPEAAEVAKAAGADGIEIHCAHETLGYSFLSPVTNRRTDKWGGGPSERARFVVEALKRVRAVSATRWRSASASLAQEFRHGGYDNMEMREMLYCIAETGLLDFVDIDTGHCWGAPSYVPSSYHPHAEFREFGKAARADLDHGAQDRCCSPGGSTTRYSPRSCMRGGYCDLVGMVRAGIADPEFANKAREGRLGEIRRCIACTRCIDEASEPKTFPYTPMCSINPVIGSELRWESEFKPAQKAKNVLVVGGGIAGCEAARVAAMRGHKVTLLEQGKRLGGQLLIAAKAPGRDSFEDQAYFEENALERLKVDVRLNTGADLAAIKALAPDAVVIATGAVPRQPDNVDGLELPHVVQGWDVMLGKASTGNRVAVISQEDYYQTPCVAEYLTSRGKQVEVFHKSVHLGTDIARYSIGMVLKRMEDCGVKVHPNLILKKIEQGAIELVSSWGGHRYRFEGFDSVVLVYGAVPVHTLYDELKADGGIAELYLAGAAWLPRRLAEATRQGANIGLVI
jgi:2,4-dienoyl-CoA reductase-like NADH-dependent reductase (Old Yellow Enzyme family)/thioredoxin reductase